MMFKCILELLRVMKFFFLVLKCMYYEYCLNMIIYFNVYFNVLYLGLIQIMVIWFVGFKKGRKYVVVVIKLICKDMVIC